MSLKVLFLTPQLPYPPVSGGVIKSWKLVEYLSARYKLRLACFLKNEDRSEEDTFRKKVKLSMYYSEEIDIPRSGLNFIKSNLKGIPLNLYRNLSGTFGRQVSRMAADADVIFVDHYEMYQYVPWNFRGRVILHQHNCEYLMWERFAAVEKNPLKKLALKNQSWWIRNYERKICNQSDRVLAAPNDIEELKKIGAESTVYLETYHLGDEHLLAAPELKYDESEEALLFVGTLTWEANVDGLLWFMREAWPVLSSARPALKFYIVGKNPDPRIKELAAQSGSNIILTGFIDDLEPYFRKCRVFVSPLRFGSGIKVKVMNAMYRGIPTATTSVGAEGLDVVNGRHLMINDDIQSMTDSIVKLLSDRELWKTLSRESRALAMRKYTWDAVMDIVRESIEE